jgi:hypothetical protein
MANGLLSRTLLAMPGMAQHAAPGQFKTLCLNTTELRSN